MAKLNAIFIRTMLLGYLINVSKLANPDPVPAGFTSQ